MALTVTPVPLHCSHHYTHGQLPKCCIDGNSAEIPASIAEKKSSWINEKNKMANTAAMVMDNNLWIFDYCDVSTYATVTAKQNNL
jgi:hypothetical protein